MIVLEGDIKITSGSENYIPWQFVNKTPDSSGLITESYIDLSLATSVELRLKNILSSEVIIFKTTDLVQKLFITDATNGKVELRPAATDFPEAAKYNFYFLVNNSTGQHPVPDGYTNKFVVIGEIPGEES